LELEQRIICLIAGRDAALERAQELEKENTNLRKKLTFYEGPHTPPSHETLRKAEAEERNEAPKKRGAPVGHEGATRIIPEPDSVEHVSARICPNCTLDPGERIGTEEITIEDTVKPPRIKVTKYVLDVHECQHCHHRFTARHKDCPTKGRFGVNLLVYSTMLKFHMRGPLRKIEEFMLYHNDFKASTKAVMDMHLRVGEICKIEYDKMVERIRAAKWRHIDETSFKVNGLKFWLWIFRTNEDDVPTFRSF
jgi:transposase